MNHLGLWMDPGLVLDLFGESMVINFFSGAAFSFTKLFTIDYVSLLIYFRVSILSPDKHSSHLTHYMTMVHQCLTITPLCGFCPNCCHSIECLYMLWFPFTGTKNTKLVPAQQCLCAHATSQETRFVKVGLDSSVLQRALILNTFIMSWNLSFLSQHQCPVSIMLL